MAYAARGGSGAQAARRPPTGRRGRPSAIRSFAAMWSAQFVSNIGSWMQTVAAQWLMLTLTSSATYVALVQTAASLPVVLFAVLAGAMRRPGGPPALPAGHPGRSCWSPRWPSARWPWPGWSRPGCCWR